MVEGDEFSALRAAVGDFEEARGGQQSLRKALASVRTAAKIEIPKAAVEIDKLRQIELDCDLTDELLLGCGLRRSEVAALTFNHLQQRDGRWSVRMRKEQLPQAHFSWPRGGQPVELRLVPM